MSWLVQYYWHIQNGSTLNAVLQGCAMKFLKIGRGVLLALASAVLLILSFPTFDFEVLVFVVTEVP